jgi:Ran GTPase-activating protein 1
LAGAQTKLLFVCTATMSRILSLHGKVLKLDNRSDIEPYLRNVDPTKIEEIHFGGNTIGVDASYALAEFLQKATSIKVRASRNI